MKPGLGVGIMLIKDNKVLLGLRNPNKSKPLTEIKGEGTWNMPGGKVEYMETLEQAAIRELKEETDLDATSLELISVSDDITDTAHYVTIGFHATAYSGEIKVMEPQANLKWEWFDLDNLPDNLYMPTEKILAKYKNNRKVY